MSTAVLAERIVEAGKRLFAEQGFHATGMRAIARAAGVSIGAIYHYFASKDEIFLAVLRQEYERRLQEARALWEQGLPASEIIRRVVELHFATLAGHKESVQLLNRAWAPETPALRAQVQALREEYAAYIAKFLEEGMEAGQIRRAHPLLTAYALLGLVEAVTGRALADDEVARELLEVGPAELADMSWRALRPEGRGDA
jgi:AcrR family transcriptional regulator